MNNQPQNMTELILSLQITHDEARHQIINTIRTIEISRLSSADRTLWKTAEAQIVAADMYLATRAPGSMLVVESQTDGYYLDNDPDNITAGLINSLNYLGQRIR